MLFTADRPILVAWNFPLTSMKLYDCFHCPLLQCIQGGCACRTSYNKKTWGFPTSFSIIVQSSPLSLFLSRNCKRKNVNLSRASPNIILCLPAVNQTKQKNNSNHKKHQNKHEHVSSKLVQVIRRTLRENFSPSPRNTVGHP